MRIADSRRFYASSFDSKVPRFGGDIAKSSSTSAIYEPNR